jgi:formamidase
VPGFGFLRDEFPDPYMARWRIEDGWASSLCPPSRVS